MLLPGLQHEAGLAKQEVSQDGDGVHHRPSWNASFGNWRCSSAPQIGGRQNGAREAGFGYRTRHAPDHAGILVLHHHRAASLDDGERAGQAVAAHAGQHDAERAGAEGLRGGAKQHVHRGGDLLAEAPLAPQHEADTCARDAPMRAARREIDRIPADRRPVRGQNARAAGRTGHLSRHDGCVIGLDMQDDDDRQG